MNGVRQRPAADGLSLSVSELTAYIKRLIERDEVLSQISVRGEISNLASPRSGHLYFSLKDEASQLRCVCFRGDACRLGFAPEDGQRVVAHGSIGVYEPRGEYQLIVRSMRPDGAGELAEAIAKLRAKLEAEGLFEPSRKRPLPRFPRRIALVTSPTGAAVRDLITVISRRYPPAEIVIVPVVVQGEAAPESLVQGLRRAAELCEPDVIVIGRGGGSLEDLWAFYDERVVRAVFASPVPVVSAVGHETDVALTDEAADLRAPTPSAAGELVVPDVRDLLAQLDRTGQRLCSLLTERLSLGQSRLQALCERPVLCRPTSMVEQRWQRLDDASMRVVRAADVGVERMRTRLSGSALTLRALDPRVRRRVSALDDRRQRIVEAERRAKDALKQQSLRYQARLRSIEASLRALDPTAVVQRGYALVWNDQNRLVRSVEQVERDENIHASVADGEIAARVTGIRVREAD